MKHNIKNSLSSTSSYINVQTATNTIFLNYFLKVYNYCDRILILFIIGREIHSSSSSLIAIIIITHTCTFIYLAFFFFFLLLLSSFLSSSFFFSFFFFSSTKNQKIKKIKKEEIIIDSLPYSYVNVNNSILISYHFI